MLDTPFSPWPSFTEEETDAVTRVLMSNRVNYWTGSECREFEKEFAAWCGTEYAVSLANGTVALDLALRVLGMGRGDEVIVTPRTFIASVSCVTAVGATPVFAEVDVHSQNITAASIRQVITPRTKAVICVHLAGWPCDMGQIMAVAEENGLYVIEDCSQAHGARYQGRSVGSIGHIGTWSFCQDKIITTGGEGGMITTNRIDWWERAWAYKDHGKSYSAVYDRTHPPGFRWLHESFGTNWRMMELQAAIGRIQLRRLKNWHERRTRHSLRLAACLSNLPGLRVPFPPPDVEHGWYKFYAFVRPERLAPGWSRDRILTEINDAGVPCFCGSCAEVYLEKAFDGNGLRPAARLPVARVLGETSLMFLVHPTLQDEEIEKTCDVVTRVMGRTV